MSETVVSVSWLVERGNHGTASVPWVLRVAQTSASEVCGLSEVSGKTPQTLKQRGSALPT